MLAEAYELEVIRTNAARVRIVVPGDRVGSKPKTMTAEQIAAAVESHRTRARPALRAAFVPARGPVEETLAAIVRAVLAVDRVGARVPVRSGLVVMLLALVGLSASVGSPAWAMAALMGLLGVGVAFVNTPLSASVSLLVRPERLPSAQSINTMLFFLGGSFGTTLVTAVLALRREATDGLNPLHGGSVGVGFSDAFLLLTVPVLVGLALSATVPGPPTAEAKLGTPGEPAPARTDGSRLSGQTGRT